MSASTQGAVNVAELLDRRVTRYQVVIFAICFAVSLVDGLDSQLTSVTGPAMARELHLPPSLLGTIFAASQWGAIVGALILGVCADRWGRRSVLIASSFLFSLMTFVTAFGDSFATIVVYRFIAGVGIGGAGPCFVALASEYAPTRLRAGMVTFIWSAVPGGGILAGILGAYFIGDYGWRDLYIGAGIASFVVSLVLVWKIPESLSFMVTRNVVPTRIRAVLNRIALGNFDQTADRFIIVEEKKTGVPIKHLFTEGRMIISVLLAAAFLCGFVALIGSLIWMPVLLAAGGLPASQGSLALAFDNFGGFLGTIIVGQLINRFRTYRALAFIFLGGALSIALLGYAAPNFIYVATLATLAGLLLGGGGAGLIALTAAAYPTFMRSTGIGWGLSFFRLAGAVAPLFVGFLLAGGLSAKTILGVLGLIALANFGIVLVLRAYAQLALQIRVQEPLSLGTRSEAEERRPA